MAHLSFILIGFAVVLGVLGLLWAIMAVIGDALGTVETPRPVPVSRPVTATVPTHSGPPAHHLAAIAAAVAVVTGGRGRVTRVVAAPTRAAAWVLAGRAELHHTHSLRRGFGLTHTKEAENDP